ncbi:hypothetical protein EV121DRAFT_271024 [Schizophyllum commune]
MATCTYQEEPPWLDYPTVRHAKRWPSLDLVPKIFGRKHVEENAGQFIGTDWVKTMLPGLKAFLAESGDQHPQSHQSFPMRRARAPLPPSHDTIDLCSPPRVSRRSSKRELPMDTLDSPPRKAIKREPEVIDLITPPRPKRESSEPMEALGPFEFQFTLDADEDVLSTASAPRYSASLHDTDADGETDSDYVPDRIVIDSDDEVEAKPAHTEWLNPAYQSYVKRGPFAITKAIAVSRIEYADFLPDYIPIPEERTAYIFDLRDSSFDIDRHGKAMTADALLKSRAESLEREGKTPMSHASTYLDMITRKHSCTARDRNGKLCTGKPKLVRSKGTFAFSTFVGCSGWRIDFKQGHKSHPLTPNVQIDLLEKLMRGDASAVTQNDTPPCPTFVPPHVGNKQSHCSSSTKDIMGGAPSGFHDSLANKRLVRDMVAKKVATDAPAGRSVPGVYDFMLQERNLPSTERYVHQVYTTTAVPMRVIIITYESSLLALIHQASFLDVDKSFKRTTELDEWEVSTFLRSHQTAITLARFYTDGADQAHFKKIFDMLRAEVQACTGRPLAFKRLSKNGTLLNFGMDMELAQILGAAESFLETNDPEFSGIHTSDPKELAQYMIRICRCHVMRPILELKREVTDEEYATLRQFPDLADSEALQKFEEFIGTWFAHKKSNYYLIPMIAQSLSKIHPDDWVVNPATTNLGEGAHARTNRETGTNLPLLDGIKAARIFDREQARRIQQERSSGVLANRNAGLAVRMKNNSTRAEKARARAAEAQEQQDQEHILKAKIEEERTAQREKAASLKELQKELAAVKATKKASGGNKRSRIKAAPAESSSYMPTHMALAGLPQAEPLEASAWPALPEPAPSQDASMLMDYSAQLYQQWGGAGPSGSSDDLAWMDNMSMPLTASQVADLEKILESVAGPKFESEQITCTNRWKLHKQFHGLTESVLLLCPKLLICEPFGATLL